MVITQRFNSFSGAIGNTWKTRQKHDDNRSATGPKQTDSTVATRHGNTCHSRKPESLALLELFCGWPQSEGVSDSFFAGGTERDETGRGVFASINLDLASVRPITVAGLTIARASRRSGQKLEARTQNQ